MRRSFLTFFIFLLRHVLVPSPVHQPTHPPILAPTSHTRHATAKTSVSFRTPFPSLPPSLQTRPEQSSIPKTKTATWEKRPFPRWREPVKRGISMCDPMRHRRWDPRNNPRPRSGSGPARLVSARRNNVTNRRRGSALDKSFPYLDQTSRTDFGHHHRVPHYHLTVGPSITITPPSASLSNRTTSIRHLPASSRSEIGHSEIVRKMAIPQQTINARRVVGRGLSRVAQAGLSNKCVMVDNDDDMRCVIVNL
ncbi:hypothetical protein BC938DRAFT_478270 [Jimgerdemannia flammicorona]|uniref:Uncharacterized protein n=1 Tax=Jimgerdemannia flammicorona TaxID=994334 RepID=A0A433QYI3_9FUNG|nr:hypothetical protein BC938DRAFT_478270 [Jimgerdemannia flammicorona]